MAKSTLGNNTQPVCFLTEYEVEVGEDEYENMNGELVDEEDIIGYRCTCPKNSDSATVTIYFYYYAPASEWYWDYNYGIPYGPVIPVVFTCDSNWNLITCLNQSFSEIDLSNRSSGWISMNVTLNRKLVKNEKIIFGVYSDMLGVASSRNEWNSPGETNCYNYYSQARRRNYSSATAYVSSSEFIQKAESVYSDWEVCLYLEYVNEVESVAYTRTVLGNIQAATSNSRKTIWKRTLKPSGTLASSMTRKAGSKRNAVSSGSLVSLCQRHILMKRGSSSSFAVSTSNSKKIFFNRVIENTSALITNLSRFNKIKISKSENLPATSLVNRYAKLKTQCESVFETQDSCSRANKMKRESSARFGFSEAISKRIQFSRLLETPGNLSSRTSRINRMKIEKSEGFSLSDNLQQLLFIIRSCFSSADSLGSLNHIADYKRMPKSIVDDEESIIRWGESYRSFADEVEFEARPFASRLFFRTVQTVMSLWDWLRGKIREANNVITLFSPIYTEVTLESKI